MIDILCITWLLFHKHNDFVYADFRVNTRESWNATAMFNSISSLAGWP